MLGSSAQADLLKGAAEVLRGNDAGAWTKPSPAQYPHQWNWDSGFISLGWSRLDWSRAATELESMLSARWRSGMVPHVHYDPAHVDGYFPGPDWWPRAQAQVLRTGVLTSGITNPPVLVVSAHELGLRQPDNDRRRAWWERVYPDLRDFVLFFARHRTLRASPLPVMVHPWESGWDNSPRWDFLRDARLKPSRRYQRLDTRSVDPAQRPTGKDYDSFLALVELLEATDYNVSAYRERSPFCVHDVLIDAIWYRAAVALNSIASSLRVTPPIAKAQLAEYVAAFEQTHWNQELGGYYDLNLVDGRQITVPTAAGPAALFGGFQTPARAARCWDEYRRLSGAAAALCTYPPGEPAFEATRYWRGPVWIPVNWLAADGLRRCGLAAESDRVMESSLELISQGGFSEYFNPLDGSACGAGSFSWTAALCLDWLGGPTPQ